MPIALHFFFPGLKVLGSVVASVVGLSHLFRAVADSKSARLRALASFLRKSCKSAYGKLEIVLRRNPIVSVDENAVSVLVPNPDRTFDGGKSRCLRILFAPHTSDSPFISFSISFFRVFIMYFGLFLSLFWT